MSNRKYVNAQYTKYIHNEGLPYTSLKIILVIICGSFQKFDVMRLRIKWKTSLKHL